MITEIVLGKFAVVHVKNNNEIMRTYRRFSPTYWEHYIYHEGKFSPMGSLESNKMEEEYQDCVALLVSESDSSTQDELATALMVETNSERARLLENYGRLAPWKQNNIRDIIDIYLENNDAEAAL